jgi:hypothetical protein
MITVDKIREQYLKTFYIEDPTIIDLALAVVVGVKIKGDPIWLMIIGASSSGKSELINTLIGVDFVHQVSSLTENTFLSGMKAKEGKEISLLHKIGKSGVIVMKDYTSILSMKYDRRENIISQMREIYDGYIVKETGNGLSDHWKGKINFIGGVTDSVYIKEGESAGMGRRTINYIMPKQNRKKTLQQARQNTNDIEEKREKIRSMIKEYVEKKVKNLPTELPKVDNELGEELMLLSDFLTHARTPTERDYKGELVLVQDLEMPMRVFQQLQSLAQLFQLLNDGPITDAQKGCLYKISLDSIPKLRRIALKIISSYDSVTTKGLAQFANYPTKTARHWLEDLNVLGIITRTVDKIGNVDKWTIRPEFREIMIKYDGIIHKKDSLIGDESYEEEEYDLASKMANYDPGLAEEQDTIMESAFEDLDLKLKGQTETISPESDQESMTF